jgi:hypothetical protein
VNIIPREKTYNVASIVSKSASVGGGAIAGVVNFGGSLIRGRQTYYLVQDQDTLALPEPPASGICSSGKAVTFVWQFRPVLGQKVVRDGVRQTFAQIAMPPGSTAVACSAKVQIHTSWRRYDVKTGRVGDPIAGTEGDSTSHVPSYDLQPAPTGVVTQDNGDGTVTVIATGGFKTGMRVRIGTQVIDATSPALFEQNAHYIKFIASASSIALMGAFLVNRDGTEAQVIQPRIGATAPSGCQTAVSPISGTGTAQAAPPPPTAVTPAPFTDTTSMVTLPVDPADLPGPVEVAVVVIGTQVFGLMNSPFFSNDGKNVALIVSNDLLRVNNQIKWMKLFSNTPPHTYAIQAASGFAVSGIALLASGVTNSQGSGSGLGSLFAISGSNIKNLKVLIPANTPDGEYNADTIRTIWLSGDQVQNFKSVVVQNPGGAPMVLALPKAAGAGTTPAKPSLDPQPAAGIAATAKTLTITGGGMSQVAAVLSGGTPLAFTAPTDKSLTLTLPALSTPGITVVFIYMDKSLQPYFIPVAGAAH